MKSREGSVLERIRERLGRNIFIQALPYALLISFLTFSGMFAGYFFFSGPSKFVISILLSLMGFATGVVISYMIVMKF